MAYSNSHNVRISKGSYVHFKATNVTTNQFFKIIDLSDTVNYPHEFDNVINLEFFQTQVDAEALSEFEICLGYMSDVDGSSGTFNCFKSWQETKAVGTSFSESLYWQHPGLTIDSSHILTKDITVSGSLSSAATPKSTLYPAGDITGFGNGDIVIAVIVVSGSVNVTVEGLYYTEE